MGAVEDVREFNRFYTRTIGVLDEHLLESDFSLTEVRVLYELSHRERPTATELSRELGLDAGYLSRILRRFGRLRLVETEKSSRDGRSRLLSLTPRGRATFAPLDRRSSEQVEALLAGVSDADRERLVRSMQRIAGILGRAAPAPVTLRPHRPGDMGWVVQRHGELYWREYRYDERFEALVAEIVAHFVRDFDSARERCWIAERGGERLGSIFLVRESAEVARLRLLLVEPHARGLGVGRRLVDACIGFARESGYAKIVLWTQSELLAARRIYEACGFARVGEEPHRSWGREDMVAESWELELSSTPAGSSPRP
jgi:DNA-binding MarR family transcriptional regulator/N-acetylglutamate synthase-like GNAT family acetyltransferase